jgi:hypothetical protein
MTREEAMPTEKTPKGYEVPVPKRREFFSNLKKIARPKPKDSATPASGAKK